MVPPPWPPCPEMSEETRQKKLAAARKKLREFQRKNSLLPPETKKKKKKKDGGSPETTTPDGCPSPEKIQDILKVLVSDLNRSNGVALSPLDKWKAPKDRAAPAAPPTDDTMSPDGVLDQCASPPLVASMASTQNHDVENGPSPLDGNMFSSTEGLRQLSQQLNGLVAESTAHVNGEVLASTTDTKFPEPSAHVNGEVLASIADTNSPEPSAHVNGEVLASTTDTKFPEPAAHVNMEIPASIADINSPESAPYINGEGVASTADTKSLESRYQELAVALESSKVENKQLCSKIEQLEQQNRETQDELHKEKKECEQKIWNERGSLRKQLQVHIQTIGILVSEKSELQTALYHTENAVRKREGMAQQFASRLQSSQQRIQELERTVTTLTAQQKQAKRKKDELSNDRDALTVELVKRNSTIDDLKQQKSELEEKLRVLMTEKSVTETGVEELQKKLEMSDLLLKQFSSPSPTTDDGKQQLQEALEERAQLETRVGQLQDTLKQLQVERDRYAENLKEDNAIWCRRMQQMTGQMRKLYDEKDDSMNRVRELEATVAELKSQIAVPPPQTAPAGPSEMEQQLQVEAAKLQKELESLAAQLQAQVQDNQNLSCLNQEQERRLLELEREAENWEQQTEQHKQILETMQSDRVTISRALSQNRELKEQLAELQNGFVKLSNENMEITSTLQTEQHTKNELAKNLGQLQEKLQELKEMVELKSQEAQSLQQQRDQYLSHLQQHVAACQQLAAEKEMLYRQVLQQTQLIEHLQQRETQDKAQADMVRQELQETQGQLEAANQENQKLQAQLREMALPGEGDGLDTEEEDKEAPKPKLSVPEDLDSREAMMAFFNSALASAQKEQAELRAQLKEQKLRCRRLAQLAAAPQHQLEEAKNLMEETPHVIDETKGLAEKTPNVINETEGIAEKNPDVMKTASGIMKKMPDVMDEMEGIAEKTPDVMKMASGIMEKTPDVMDEMEGIAEKTPDVMDEMEGIAEKTPDVMKTASGIMEKTPDVMDEMEGIAEKTPDVIDETAGFVEEVPPGNGGDCVPKEIHQSLQVAMDQLQDRFVKVMQEKADLKERLDELEHRCIQLSGETDTIGEYITLYQSQRAVMKQRHREKEEYISRLAKDKEEIKVKLLELQELLLRLVNERNEWYGRFLAAAQNSAGKPILALPAPQETGAANSQDGLDEVSLADSGEHIQGEALRVSASPEHPTEQKIMKLLREIQNPREHAGLGSKPCFPFFYRVDEHDQVKVLVI